MRVILVLGNKLLLSGAMSCKFRERVERAILVLSRTGDMLVITGGTTRAGFQAEAEAGLSLVPENLKAKTRVETESKSTSENIKFSRELLSDIVTVESLVVVTSKSHVPRTRLLVKKFWPEVYPKTSFEEVGRSTATERFVEYVLCCLAIVDPNDRVFLPLLKKFFRNG